MNKNKKNIGTWITSFNPSAVHLMSSLGFKWLCVDMEHSTITFDQMGNYTTGTGFRQPVVKEGRVGLLNSILGKLPPEMRRAGRDVVQTIRRNLPIGPITGGRVFPPFL